MKMSIKSVKPQTKKIKNYLYKIQGTAIANNKYYWAIDIFEKYRRDYIFSDNQLYALAMFYDHLAMFNKSKKAKKDRVREYLRKAESIYQEILNRNPKFHLALYGLGRVWKIRGNYRKALYYQKKAYHLMLRLSKKERGALAIGYTYEEADNYKKAEEWYKKEYSDLKNDFGTALNLFLFYKRRDNYDKALLYLPKVEQLLKKEYKKKVYRGLRMRESKFFKGVLKELEELRKAKGSG